jgi:hypothetical protein
MRLRLGRLWLRASCWVVGFTLVTALGVLVGRAVIPATDIGPSYICFWAAGKLLASGQSPYDPALQARIQQQYGWDKATDGLGFWDFLPYFYPPSLLAPLCVLFVPLGYPTAKIAWLVINVELFLLTGYLLRRAVTGVPQWIPMLVVPFFALSIFSVLVGQITSLIFFLVAAVWRLLQERWERSAGWLLAWMTIKPQLTLLFLLATLLWAMRQRRWRVIEGFAVGLFVLLTVSTLLVPSWPIQLVRTLVELPQATAERPWVGSTWMLLLRTLGLHGFTLWTAYLVAVVPLLLLLLRSSLDLTGPLDEVIALSLLTAFFLAPYGRVYDFPVLLIPLLLLLGGRLPEIWSIVLPFVFLALPFVHLLWLLTHGSTPYGAVGNFMPQVWMFWIPSLLTIAWLGSRFGNLAMARPPRTVP